MGKESLPASEVSKDAPKEVQKDVKPIDTVAQKKASDERKVAEFTSAILEDPKMFLEKIKKDPRFAAENKQLIKQAIIGIHKPIFADRDRITDELWNSNFVGKVFAVQGTLLQGLQDALGGGNLGPTNKIWDFLESVK